MVVTGGQDLDDSAAEVVSREHGSVDAEVVQPRHEVVGLASH